jgi:hypothetical protein
MALELRIWLASCIFGQSTWDDGRGAELEGTVSLARISRSPYSKDKGIFLSPNRFFPIAICTVLTRSR